MQVYGSANLVQTLIKHDLVDAFWLKIFRITLGGGKRLFADGTIPTAFEVTESTVTSKGVAIVNYELQAQSQPEVYKHRPGEPGFDLAATTNTVGLVHAKIVKGGPRAVPDQVTATDPDTC